MKGMEPISPARALLEYAKSHAKLAVAFLLSSAVCLVIYSLYQVWLAPALYTVLVLGALALIYAAWDFYHFYHKYVGLCALRAKLDAELSMPPLPRDLIEQTYQDMVQDLFEDRMRRVSQGDAQKNELIDYYTLWAHQIKTPIAAMRLLLQAGETKSLALEQELFKIEQYAEMVLCYLRLESMSADLILARHPLDALVRQAVKRFAGLFILKKLALDLGALDCTVTTDEKWLVFVLEQLLSNALKYTERGGVSIYLDPDEEKTLVIADTGIGIRREDIPRIFERGYTGYVGRADRSSTGIGLYLCKRILDKLSHGIRITSQPGAGTQVRLSLSAEQYAIE